MRTWILPLLPLVLLGACTPALGEAALCEASKHIVGTSVCPGHVTILQPARTTDRQILVTRDATILRAGPSLDYPEVATVPMDTRLTVDRPDSDGWTAVYDSETGRYLAWIDSRGHRIEPK